MKRLRVRTPERTKLVRDYIEKYKNHDKKSIARALYADHPTLFKDLEAARGCVRYHTGANGKDARAHLKDKSLMRKKGSSGQITMPKSIAKAWSHYTLGLGEWLVISDLHVPYHDEEAVMAAVNFGKEKGIENVMINGDLLDFFSISTFLSNPAERDLAGEVLMGREFLMWLRQEFSGKIVFKLGNHEERWQKYLWNKAPELLGIADFELYKVFNLEDLNIDLVDDQRRVKAGRLHILHGHEMAKGWTAPINPSRGAWLRTNGQCLVSHYHRTSEHSEKNLNGKVLSCWSIGCLSDLTPAYARVNKYNHGFATLKVHQGGKFHVNNYRIQNGEVC